VSGGLFVNALSRENGTGSPRTRRRCSSDGTRKLRCARRRRCAHRSGPA